MPDTLQSSGNRTSERRLYPRKQLWFPWIRVGADNGGIILDISESGLAMQGVRSLAEGQLPAMRFQLSESRTWIETRGRIAWINASKKTVGVEFVDLPDEARKQIRQWVPLPLHPNGSADEKPVGEQIEAAKIVPPAREPERAIEVSEPESTGRVVEDQSRNVIDKELVGVLPSAVETRGAETVSEGSAAESREPSAAENAGHRTGSPVALSYGRQYGRQIGGRRRSIRLGKSGRQIWGWVVAALLLSAFGYLAFHFRASASNNQAGEVTDTAKVLEVPANSPPNTERQKSIVDPPPLESPSFVLQVGAMTYKSNADALAESLRKRNFPAFVSHRETDRFYRVVVGPYHGVDATSKVEEELNKQDVDPIRKQWNP
jgi:septal ring-binding cell division protein DamX